MISFEKHIGLSSWARFYRIPTATIKLFKNGLGFVLGKYLVSAKSDTSYAKKVYDTI